MARGIEVSRRSRGGRWITAWTTPARTNASRIVDSRPLRKEPAGTAGRINDRPCGLDLPHELRDEIGELIGRGPLGGGARDVDHIPLCLLEESEPRRGLIGGSLKFRNKGPDERRLGEGLRRE